MQFQEIPSIESRDVPY